MDYWHCIKDWKNWVSSIEFSPPAIMLRYRGPLVNQAGYSLLKLSGLQNWETIHFFSLIISQVFFCSNTKKPRHANSLFLFNWLNLSFGNFIHTCGILCLPLPSTSFQSLLLLCSLVGSFSTRLNRTFITHRLRLRQHHRRELKECKRLQIRRKCVEGCLQGWYSHCKHGHTVAMFAYTWAWTRMSLSWTEVGLMGH